MRFLILVGLLILVLSGCLLKQEAPSRPLATSKQLIGLVVLQDVQGAMEKSKLSAIFTVKETKAKIQSKVQALAQYRESKKNKVECRISKIKNQTRAEADDSEDESPFVSVGKLFFGQALQSDLLEVAEQSDHRYLHEFEETLPSGVYQVRYDGSDLVRKRVDTVSMPEALKDVSGSDKTVFEEKKIIQKQTEPFTMTWKPEVIPNNQTLILSDLMTHPEGEDATLIRCIGYEKDFPTKDGVRVLQLPVEGLKKMAVAKEGDFYLARAHAHLSDAIDVEYQGLRVHYYPFELNP